MSPVMAIGSGLISGRTNSNNDFTVYTDSGFGGLAVEVNGPSRASIKYSDNHDGSIKVTYVPSVAGDYQITIKHNGINLRGSPYNVRVRGDEAPRNTYSSSTSPAYGKAISYDKYGSGISKVRVSGRGLYSGIKNIQNEIQIDVRDAGNGRLHWAIEGPGNVESKNRGIEDGVYRLFYRPDRAGEYKITIKYNEVELFGSPFKVHVV